MSAKIEKVRIRYNGVELVDQETGKELAQMYMYSDGSHNDVAKRMVDCWNALEDLPQAALDGGWTRAGLEAYGLRLEKQRNDMLAALVVAREFISTDRNSLADCSMDSDGRMSEDDAAAVADYDKALLQIDAAIRSAA